MSGIRAQIAIKSLGQNLRELRTAAYDIQARMQAIDGIVDLQIEPQIEISQVQMRVKREQAARYGLATGRRRRAIGDRVQRPRGVTSHRRG